MGVFTPFSRLSTPLLAVTGLGAAVYYGYRYKAQLLNAMTPTDAMTRHADISYGDTSRHVLDVYAPTDVDVVAETKLPVMVFVHGGSWNKGSKDDYVFLAESLTRAGFLVVVINYRLAPKHVYPDYVMDTAQAIAWTYRHIAAYGGDSDRLFVMGHSAGAFNAVAAVNTPQFFADENFSVSHVKAVIGVAGPYSYDFRDDPTDYAFPKEGDPDEIMPDRLVRDNPVPHLLLLAEHDDLVKHFNTHDMAAALQRKGGDVQVVTIAKAKHINVIAAFSRRLSWVANTREVVLDYLQPFL